MTERFPLTGYTTSAQFVNAMTAIRLRLADVTLVPGAFAFDKILITSGTGMITPSAIDAAKLAFLDVSSSINTSLSDKLSLTLGGTVTGAVNFRGVTKFGTAANYTQFDANGHQTMEGDATVFEDLVVPLTTAKLGSTNKPDFDYTSLGYVFDENDVTETLSFIVQLPHAWKEGSTIYPHLHCKKYATDPAFVLTYAWFNVGDAVADPATVHNIDTVLYGTDTGDHCIMTVSGNTGISGAGKTISSILVCKLHRVANSTPNEDVLVYQLDFHYQKNSLGSNTEYTK